MADTTEATPNPAAETKAEETTVDTAKRAHDGDGAEGEASAKREKSAETTTNEAAPTTDGAAATAAATTEATPAATTGDSTAAAVGTTTAAATDGTATEAPFEGGYFELPNDKVGLIIGARGANISAIQQHTQTHIDIPPTCEEGTHHRKVKITGTPQAVEFAKEVLSMRLSGNPSMPPFPGTAPAVAASATATVSAAPAAPTTVKEIYVPGDQVGRIIGRQGSTIRTIQELSGAHADIETADGADGRRCIKISGTPEQIAECERHIDAKLRGESLPVPATAGLNANEMKVSIPNNMVGRIIGRAGSTIREIQGMSGCHLDIAKDPDPTTGQRDIVVKGSPHQCMQACSMMNETIAGLTGDFQTQYVIPAYDYQTMWAQQGIDVNQPAYGAPQQGYGGGYGGQQQAYGGYQQQAYGGYQQPAAGGYQQGGYQQGGYQQPAAGGYQQAAAGGYQQPAAGAAAGYQQPAAGGYQQAGAYGQQQQGYGSYYQR